MAWKIYSALQAHGNATASDFPGGAYRIRFLHSTNPTTFGSYLGDLISDPVNPKYALPYIETESTYPGHDENGVLDPVFVPRQSDAVWEGKMIAFADAFAAAGVEYIEFGNEPNHPSNITNRHRLWDSYAARLEKSAPIWRERGIGVMLTSLGPSAYNQEWMVYLNSASKKAFRCIDAVAIHCYSGGTHALRSGQTVGDDALGTPIDTLRRMEDARTALTVAAPNRPELEFYITEMGWPSYWAANAAAQPGITDETHQTYSTPQEQAQNLSDLYLHAKNGLYANALQSTAGRAADRLADDPSLPNGGVSFNRCRMAGWFHSTDYRDGKSPDYAVLASDYTWPGSGTLNVTIQSGSWDVDVVATTGSPDPADGAAGQAKLTNGTQVITFTGKTDTSFTGVAGGSGTWAAGTQIKADTTGNWAHHHGIRYEEGTPRSITVAGSGHKESWKAWEGTAPWGPTAVGIGRGNAGVKPVCVRGAVSAIGNTTATVAGTVDPNALATSWRVEHGPDANFGKMTTTATAGSSGSPVPISANLTGLAAGATNHWRITAWNDAGTAWSDKGTFDTTGVGGTVWVTPTRTTVAPHGSVAIATDEGIATSPNPTLLPNTTYYYRLVATNSAGTSDGAQQSFTTAAIADTPTVTTGPATAVTMTGATLNGVINPNGTPISDFHFEYGLTPTTLSTSTTPGFLVSGTTDRAVVAIVDSLVPGETYFYKLVATNDFGTVDGLTRSLVVTPPPTGTSPELAHITTIPIVLGVEVTTHDGRHYRWSTQEANSHNLTMSVNFATQLGDGFAEASCQLPRPIDLDWPDLNLLDQIRFIAADGDIAYEGRVVGLPRRVDSDGEVIEVQIQGLMASARDRPFMEIYVDRSGDRWQQASLAQRLAHANNGNSLDTDYVPQVDTGSLSFKGTTGKLIHRGSQGCLFWRAPAGCKAAQFHYKGDRKGASITTCEASALFYHPLSDVTHISSWDSQPLNLSDNVLRSLTLPTPAKLLGIRLRQDTVGGNTPSEDNAAHLIIHKLAVVGNHGVPVREHSQDGPKGVLVSDVMKDLIERFCPRLNFDGVKQTSTVIANLVFDTPTTPFDAFLLLNGYHLWTLGAWEDGRVDFSPPDLTKADWQVRHDDPGITLDLQGDTVDDAGIANGMPVSYTDIDDRAMVLWPDDYEQLRDENPDNPANRWGDDRWPVVLELSNPVTKQDALTLGGAALAEFNRPKAPGTITSTLGYVEDAQGNLQPGHRVRANQTLSITSLPNDTPRLITATNWNEDGNLTVTLEQPPTRIDAVLARLDLSQRVAGIG